MTRENPPVIATSLPFYESVTRAQDAITGKAIRVWRREADRPTGPDREVLKLLMNERLWSLPDPLIVGEISKLERIAAIEIIGRDGTGFVEYLEW